MKYFKVIAPLLILLFLLLGNLSTPIKHRETEFLMDTVVTVTAYGNEGKAAVQKVFLRLRELDAKFNAHSEKSELAKINTAPENTPVPVDKEAFKLIKSAHDFSITAEGFFDITLLPLSNLWGFGTENTAVPTENELENAMKQVGFTFISLDPENCTVTKHKAGIQLDLGAVVKGYAADEAMHILKESGVESAYLDLGGNVAVMGGMPQSLWKRILSGQKTRPFVIGLQEPGAPSGTAIDTLSLTDGFIVTSGDYERFFEADGMRYHHILDPATGKPAQSSLRSVTIVSKNGLMADMLSTALFVAGEKEMSALYDLCEHVITINDAMELTYVK
ncbi:MAG: FAD:protein FMN transferase [Clostridia bacterium]|nr:FAD:protein FMN transferase [Clostridia bacterium]